MNKIEVSKVEIKIGKKIIPLSLEEAKELKDILNETFPDPSPTIINNYPNRWWHEPIINYPLAPRWGTTVTCNANGENTAKYSLTE